jgi:hypothetical protein
MNSAICPHPPSLRAIQYGTYDMRLTEVMSSKIRLFVMITNERNVAIRSIQGHDCRQRIEKYSF